mgnify:CR=1 FL=1
MRCKKCNKEFKPEKGLTNYCSLKCRNSREQTQESNDKRKGINSIRINEDKLCDYNCGEKAFYLLTSGNFCCSIHQNKCKAKRIKNSKTLKLAYKEGRRDLSSWKENSKKGSLTYVENLKKKPFEFWGRTLKKKLLLEEQNNKCLWCKNDKWNGINIQLEVDHINGNKKDECRENLRLLCPNCHAQTDTYKIKNKK